MGEVKREFISALFEQHGSGLVKYLTARFQSAEEAKEVAQEAWLRLYRLKQPQDLDNAKAFLYQTAANVGIDRVRRAQLERKHAHPNEERSADIETTFEAQQTLTLLEEALTELPLKCRQAFTMHRHHGFSYPEIARQLGVSTSMVEKYIIQTLKHFRNKLEQPHY